MYFIKFTLDFQFFEDVWMSGYGSRKACPDEHKTADIESQDARPERLRRRLVNIGAFQATEHQQSSRQARRKPLTHPTALISWAGVTGLLNHPHLPASSYQRTEDPRSSPRTPSVARPAQTRLIRSSECTCEPGISQQPGVPRFFSSR